MQKSHIIRLRNKPYLTKLLISSLFFSLAIHHLYPKILRILRILRILDLKFLEKHI